MNKGFTLPQALAGLKDMARWCAWELVFREGNAGQKPQKPAKRPLNPRTGGGAMANEPSTWGDLGVALDMAGRKAAAQGLTIGENCGVGFFLGGGIAGIDLDGVIRDDGILEPFAAEIVRRMDSYTEYSPSGKGLHILCKVADGMTLDGKNGVNDRDLGLEIYCGGHYFTMTGNVYGHEKPLESREKAMLEIYREYFVKGGDKVAEKWPVNASAGKKFSGVAGDLSDAELLQRMFESQRGRDIRRLYDGDISGYDNDDSRADLAFCAYLAYWTGGDAGRMDRIFRQSGLYRNEGRAQKWDEQHGVQTYGATTIAKAISTTQDYTCGKPVTHDWKYYPETDTPQGFSGDLPVSNSGALAARPHAEKALRLEGDGHTVLGYLENCLYSDLERVKTYRNRKTGYLNIDRYNSLFPGLYVVGSLTGGGKTTFCGQMADYLARAGEYVLYFALEQTELELVTKGLARLTAQEVIATYGNDALTKYEHTDAMSAIDIRKGNITAIVKRAIDTYKTFADRLQIVECGFETDIDSIINTVKQFMTKHEGIKPVVFLDYLQLVRNSNPRLTTKDAVDENVRAFKKLSAECELAVILISSLNRQNYLSVIDFEAFKESGSIEFTADVIWGLQLLVMNAGVFNSEKDLQTKRKFVHEALSATPRKMELIGLKNRYGRSNQRFFFDYFPAHDLFIPCECDAEAVDAEMAQAYETFKAACEGVSGSIGKGKRI